MLRPGFEPGYPCGCRILSAVRLPIPPAKQSIYVGAARSLPTTLGGVRLRRILFEISIRYLLEMRLHFLMPGQVSVCTVTSTTSATVGFTNYQVPMAEGVPLRTVRFHSIVMAPIAHFI